MLFTPDIVYQEGGTTELLGVHFEFGRSSTPKDYVRAGAARVLEIIGDPRGIEPLILAFQQDKVGQLENRDAKIALLRSIVQSKTAETLSESTLKQVFTEAILHLSYDGSSIEYAVIGQLEFALKNLESYLELNPNTPDRPRIEHIILQLKK